ncbi:unnamed protein product [Lymnaea stagnalis]|uniref:Uncharacterized protein n=1 Tax=Lymnaea stagnalis TaxID=6523 RepID=A0AAV2HZI9_LYMST
MGKDDDKNVLKRGSVSKKDLMDEHVRLVQKEKELSQKYDEVKAIFQKLDEAYQTSKGTFSVQRYGKLKDMIKSATSESNIQQIQQAIQASPGQTAAWSGLTGLLSKAKVLSGESQDPALAQPPAKAPEKSSSFIKKIKKLTGFSDDPITDEEVMSEAQLTRDNGRKQRAITLLTNQLSKAVTQLEKLRQYYEASKSHAPPKRYQELKEMIKNACAEKF